MPAASGTVQAAHGVTAILLTVVTLMGLVIWSIKRHHSRKLKIECGASIDTLIPALAGLTLSTAVGGNVVEILENGKFFDVLIARIGAAKQTLHFETLL